MSEKEFSRLNILLDVEAKRLRVDDAVQLLNLNFRQGVALKAAVICLVLRQALSKKGPAFAGPLHS
ncbi:hypothetical protein GCM10007874_44780 [Labrys miyagiensis]|uniref:Uncharacterized protein n=1 Tax=Labrys miyagiensis TaxID=346912 RepID=A0ABQ6CM87_9HYPH|nr:hypothetical protein [Labrys miyagiensis]GLS21461.1 hypothetical protein GCM10007874_44780 [Labrys miyagiensis]